MKRHGHLFDQVCDYGTLLAAARRARRGMRSRLDVARFIFHLEPNLRALEGELRSGTYRMRPYRTFTIHEPKLRRICAPTFRDRVARHALCTVRDPVVECKTIHNT